ncbi:MAG: YIP1 family protein [Acidobacteriota bacterium]|nr:YIP1 family protein [Acidobacteriota bacterium]
MTEHPGSINGERNTETGGNHSQGRNAWLKALIGIFTSPRQSFEIIRRRNPWLAPLLLLVAGSAALAMSSAPLGLQAMRNQLTERMPGNPEQVDAMMAQIEQTAAAARWVSMATGPLQLALGLAVQTVFVWLLAVALKGRPRFVQSLSLMVHLAVITHLKSWANFLLLHVRGTDAIRSQLDLQAPMGLDLLLAGDNATLNVVYASINPFTVWFLALLGLGAAAVFGVPERKAWLLAAIYWATTTAFTAAATGLAARLTPT